MGEMLKALLKANGMTESDMVKHEQTEQTEQNDRLTEIEDALIELAEIISEVM